MTQMRTIKILFSRFLSQELACKIAYAKFARSVPAYADQLAYMTFCDQYETDCFHVVATDDRDNVCGYLYCLQNDTNKALWYYGDLFVTPEVRRQGIASQMIKAAMQHLSEMGAAVLRCYVERANTASLDLQASLGFLQKDYEKFLDLDNEGQLMFEVEIPSCFSVKQASSSDARYIMVLYTQNRKALHGVRISHQNFRERLSADDEDERNFLVYKGAVPVAWLRLNRLSDREAAWIGMLIVHDTCRRQGIGQMAIRYAENYLTKKHFASVKIHVADDSVAAKALCLRMGYALETKEHTLFDDGDSGERLTFVKKLQ